MKSLQESVNGSRSLNRFISKSPFIDLPQAEAPWQTEQSAAFAHYKEMLRPNKAFGQSSDKKDCL